MPGIAASFPKNRGLNMFSMTVGALNIVICRFGSVNLTSSSGNCRVCGNTSGGTAKGAMAVSEA